MDSSSMEYYQISDKRDLGHQSGHTLLLGYEAGTGLPQILQMDPPHGYGQGPRPSPPSHFISISPLKYNKAQHDQICNFIFPRFGKKNKANLWRTELGNMETKKITAMYEHQREVLPPSLDMTLHALIQSNDWRLFSVRHTWSRARWVTAVCTYWKRDHKRLLDLTLTEFEITHLKGHSKCGRLEPLATTRYIIKEYRSLDPSRLRHSGDLPVPVTEEIVSENAVGEKITGYFRARSSEASPLVLLLYDIYWAKNCFPKGLFPEVEEGINSLLYDPPKRYDLSSQSAGGSGWHQPSLNQDRASNRSQDPRRSLSNGTQGQKARRDEGKVYLLDLKPAVESVSRYRDSKWDLYSAAQKFGIRVSEEEKNPIHDSLLIVRLWTLIFSGSPKKIREEELEIARKSALANPEAKNEYPGEDIKRPASIKPDDEDIDPNDIHPGPSDATSSSSAFGKPQVAPEVDWENPFDEDEEDY